MHRSAPLPRRLVALGQALLMLLWGGCIPTTALTPHPGITQLDQWALVPVPGGLVNAKGGNLVVSRSWISLDTPLGPFEARATYNSASGHWVWSFQMRFDGERFVDATGAVFDALSRSGTLAPNGTIVGTHWVRVDPDTIQAKGGLAYDFHPDGSLARMRWATMNHPRLEFSPTAITQCTHPSACAPLFDLALDGAGRPVSITDARSGRVVELGYDALGRLVSARSPQDVAEGRPGERYEYGFLGSLLTAVTSSEGERIEYEYQAERRILHVTQIGEGDPRHRFELLGAYLERWTTIHFNPLGGETRYHFDRWKRLREISRPSAGELTQLRYGEGHLSAVTRPATVIAPSGARTGYTVSSEDEIVEIAEPTGRVLTYTYAFDGIDPDAPLGRPTARIEDQLGMIAEVTRDASGRAVQLELGEGEAVTSTYGAQTLASIQAPLGAPSSFDVYGAHGHWTEASLPGSDFPIRRAFDPVGNPVVPAAGLQQGGVLDRGFDLDRRVERIHVATTEAGRVSSDDFVEIRRRSDGQLLSIERPLGADHEFVYDALGRPVIMREAVDGVWRETHFEYDLAGNVTARERPNGMREEFGYDAHGRLVRRASLRGGVEEGEAVIAYENGRLATFFDSGRGVLETYLYDAADRLRSIVYSSGETLDFAHDVRSRVTSRTYRLPGGASRTIGIEYDGADRPTRFTVDAAETLAEIVYQDAKQVRVEYGNGLVREMVYDPASARLVGFLTRDGNGAVVEDTQITREIRTGPQRYRVSATTTTPLASTVESYDFGLAGVLSDPDKRVGNRVWGWGDGAGNEKAYVYDGLSNLLSNAAGDRFEYNAERNRLLSADLVHEDVSHTYIYDEAGFVTERDGVPLTWTATGFLRSFGSTSIEWDQAGRPISIAAGPLVRDFLWFGGAVASDPLTGAVGQIDLGFVSVAFGGDARIFRHPDFRKNTRFVSDETGTVLTHYRYSAYGVDGVWGVGADTRRFVGSHELGGGLVLTGVRIYDSHVGRFLSPDPIFQELNQYGYTLGNPVDFLDADGREQTSQGDVADAFIDVVANALVFAGAAAALVLTLTATGSAILVGLVFFGAVGSLILLIRSIDRYRKLKGRADGGEGPRQEKKLELGNGAESSPRPDARAPTSPGGALGTLGGGSLGGGSAGFGRFGFTGLAVPAGGCGGPGSPAALARMNARGAWYTWLLALVSSLVLATGLLRRRRRGVR